MPQYLKILFSLMLFIYLVIAITVTANEKDDDLCKGMPVTVLDADGSDVSARQFVTPQELSRELDGLPDRAHGIALANINTQDIRRRLLSLDKIEDASVVRYTDGTIRVSVTPIVPVLRVLDRKSVV